MKPSWRDIYCGQQTLGKLRASSQAAQGTRSPRCRVHQWQEAGSKTKSPALAQTMSQAKIYLIEENKISFERSGGPKGLGFIRRLRPLHRPCAPFSSIRCGASRRVYDLAASQRSHSSGWSAKGYLQAHEAAVLVSPAHARVPAVCPASSSANGALAQGPTRSGLYAARVGHSSLRGK